MSATEKLAQAKRILDEARSCEARGPTVGLIMAASLVVSDAIADLHRAQAETETVEPVEPDMAEAELIGRQVLGQLLTKALKRIDTLEDEVKGLQVLCQRSDRRIKTRETALVEAQRRLTAVEQAVGDVEGRLAQHLTAHKVSW